MSDRQKKKMNVKTVLTESALPGTTQEFITVEQFRIGLRMIDTPGVPNMKQAQALVGSFRDLVKLLPSKEMTAFPMNVRSGTATWIGALARLDMISGDDKVLSFIVPQDVTIHRTNILNAENVFRKHAGSLLQPSLFNRQEFLDDETNEAEN